MEITGYDLSRCWFNFCFENPEKINPNHTALYFFCIEHCNRLGWKDKFGLPTTMAKEAIGVHSYNTFIKTLNDLIGFGFIEMIQKSQNQYSSNIIALSKFDKSLDKPLDKATIKHTAKQVESTQQSIDSIIKQLNQEQLTNNHILEIEKIINKYKYESEDGILSNCKFGIEFREKWAELMKLPKWKKKPQTAIQKSFDRLQKYDEKFSIELINRTIEGDYQGVIFQNTDTDYEKWKKQNGSIISEHIKQERKPEREDISKMTCDEYLYWGLKPEYR